MHIFTDQVGSCNKVLWGFSNVGPTDQVGPTSQRSILPCYLGKMYRQIPGITTSLCRSQWPRGLGNRSAAARLLRLWVRIPPGGMNVSCECCVFSGRGLCDELITRPEESCRLWCVIVCDLEPHEWGGRSPRWTAASKKKKKRTSLYIPPVYYSKLCSWEAIVKTTTNFFDEGLLLFLLVNIGMIIPES